MESIKCISSLSSTLHHLIDILHELTTSVVVQTLEMASLRLICKCCLYSSWLVELMYCWCWNKSFLANCYLRSSTFCCVVFLIVIQLYPLLCKWSLKLEICLYLISYIVLDLKSFSGGQVQHLAFFCCLISLERQEWIDLSSKPLFQCHS